MVAKRQIFGISGWSGNGKTHLITRLIPELNERGISVSTIKHAHHKFDIDKPGKDSFEHRLAGAKEVVISSTHRWALMHENKEASEATLKELLTSMSETDLILIEGFKSENFPRIEVFRGVGTQDPLFLENKNVVAVATTLRELDTDLPILDLDNVKSIADFIVDFLADKKSETRPSREINDCYAAPDQMVSVEEAQTLILNTTNCISENTTSTLHESLGKIISEDIASPINLPPADNSAVDGYAFNYADYENSSDLILKCVGRTAAGDAPHSNLQPGECIKIFTGAQMPRGADTVAMLEDVTVDGNTVTLPSGLREGVNRRIAGEDIKLGELAIPKGTLLSPPHIGRLASLGIFKVPVFSPLNVALFSTGNELQEPGSILETGHIYDSNRYMLEAILRSYGIKITDYGILPDDPDLLQSKLKEASIENDLLITSGGVSMGEEDHVKSAVRNLGNLHFWKIAIKPGRPLAIGHIGAAIFVGLPGNPVAAMVCCLQFIRPIIAKLRGESYRPPTPIIAKAAFSMTKKPGRMEWLRGQYSMDAQGTPRVAKFYSQGSGLITSLTWANGLIELDADCTHVSEDDNVKFIPLSELYR
ncbi:bifunctional molybdopterin-guanine dinucleotide biosynthesis adaptor protein MobB/molybdopterin molybdotransferase MoeA [Sneathiella limimaris]|uniref:bifunctional molybdopterin-guanine dinucleotide biosynthesis adaptor protein MobB/molybdopterin molybdotransferase MoeA n=1 Tax=Sneathiella limimaris TaxID=1964213 RepID=UPI00146DA3FF|nr:bifunctional molybdopterin-guanine dinucleotide biosynthesis adaptor protein MobB/molybdopterin molybdotransferase MoeA [Sneathiella limimaris]